MKSKLIPLFAGLLASALTSLAQPVSLESMLAAAKFRSDLAKAVAANEQTPGHALAQLRTRDRASGLALERDADLGTAALEVGHRLLALEKPEEAAAFFRTAEQSFEQALNRTSRGQAKERAGHLAKLALIRANYLNKVAQAGEDIDEAILLQPENKELPGLRAQLTAGKSKQLNGGK
jgi:hypothetical protein